MWRRFASNALANLVTGVSGTIFQIALTAVASRTFDREGFSVWTLALSMAALVPLFAASLSTIVTRQLLQHETQASAIMGAARQVAFMLCLVALTVITLLGFSLSRVSIPLASQSSWAFSILVLGLSAAQLWQIGAQPRFGWSFARERNWQVAGTIIGVRSGALISMIAAAHWGHANNPLLIAYALAIGSVVGMLVSFRMLPGPVPGSDVLSPEQRTHQAQIVHLLKGFAVWSVGSAAIQYGLPGFMSLIAAPHYNAFFLAYTLNITVIGTVAAAASALLAPLTRLRVSGNTRSLHAWLTWAPIATGIALLALLATLWIGLAPLLVAWSPGIASAEEVRHHLRWLGLQTIARSIALIYSVLLSSAGTPRQLGRPIIAEMSLTCLVAAPLGWLYGDTAFLSALAVAGLLTAIYTAWCTLKMEALSTLRRRSLLARFMFAQCTSLGPWLALAHS